MKDDSGELLWQSVNRVLAKKLHEKNESLKKNDQFIKGTLIPDTQKTNGINVEIRNLRSKISDVVLLDKNKKLPQGSTV